MEQKSHIWMSEQSEVMTQIPSSRLKVVHSQLSWFWHSWRHSSALVVLMKVADSPSHLHVWEKDHDRGLLRGDWPIN